MVSFTTTAVAIVAACSLIAPVAAGPVGGLISVGAGIAGAAIHRRGETSLWARDDKAAAVATVNENLEQIFADCHSAMQTSPPVKQVVGDDKSISMEGVPAVCMTDLAKYNALPEIKAVSKDGTHGQAVSTGPNSVKITGTTDEITTFIEGLGKTNGQAA